MHKIQAILSDSPLSQQDREKITRCILNTRALYHECAALESIIDEKDFREARKLVEETFTTICCSVSDESWTNPDSFYKKIKDCLHDEMHFSS